MSPGVCRIKQFANPTQPVIPAKAGRKAGRSRSPPPLASRDLTRAHRRKTGFSPADRGCPVPVVPTPSRCLHVSRYNLQSSWPDLIRPPTSSSGGLQRKQRRGYAGQARARGLLRERTTRSLLLNRTAVTADLGEGCGRRVAETGICTGFVLRR